MILVSILLLCCVSLQAQMYIGNGVSIHLEGNSSIVSDSIITESASKSLSKIDVKKVGEFYILSGKDQSLVSREKSPELKSKNAEIPKKKIDEFLGEEKRKKIAKSTIPNPKPPINYTSQNHNEFKSKSKTEVFAIAGNSISISKKAVSTVNSKNKIAPIIGDLAQEKTKLFFLNNSLLSIYLNSFRSRPPPFSAFI